MVSVVGVRRGQGMQAFSRTKTIAASGRTLFVGGCPRSGGTKEGARCRCSAGARREMGVEWSHGAVCGFDSCFTSGPSIHNTPQAPLHPHRLLHVNGGSPGGWPIPGGPRRGGACTGSDHGWCSRRASPIIAHACSHTQSVDLAVTLSDMTNSICPPQASSTQDAHVSGDHAKAAKDWTNDHSVPWQPRAPVHYSIGGDEEMASAVERGGSEENAHFRMSSPVLLCRCGAGHSLGGPVARGPSESSWGQSAREAVFERLRDFWFETQSLRRRWNCEADSVPSGPLCSWTHTSTEDAMLCYSGLAHMATQ